MTVNGLRKTTLLDYPGHVACTIFLADCNMRCPFCHNATLVSGGRAAERIGEDELFSFLARRRGVLEGVCVSGGEPTLNAELPRLLEQIKSLGYAVKLDTNGTSPDMLEALIVAKLVDYVAMDIKSTLEKYPAASGIADFDTAPVCRSVRLLIESGAGFDYEFRTTVVEGLHESGDFETIGNWLSGGRRYFLQHFVDSGNLIMPGMRGCDEEKMKEFAAESNKFIKTEIRGI